MTLSELEAKMDINEAFIDAKLSALELAAEKLAETMDRIYNNLNS